MLRTIPIVAIMFFAGPVLANSQRGALHDVNWYIQHVEAQQQTLAFCHADAARQKAPDCANAESAAVAIMGREYARHSNLSNMTDPDYWNNNRIARNGILAQCARRGPGDELVLPYCRAAALSRASEARMN